MATYKIMYNENMPKPYYVAKRVTTFWQQCSKYYTLKGYAKRAMDRLIERDKQNELNKSVENESNV